MAQCSFVYQRAHKKYKKGDRCKWQATQGKYCEKHASMKKGGAKKGKKKKKSSIEFKL